MQAHRHMPARPSVRRRLQSALTLPGKSRQLLMDNLLSNLALPWLSAHALLKAFALAISQQPKLRL